MKKYANNISEWYSLYHRPLPWRQDTNPYHVWISEIMLQQTRIEAVIDYYHRFIQTLPTIQDLAIISEEELLKLWEGLGYYNRAKNLKKAALIIMDKYHGQFPTTYEAILQLPGIGEYTASAIASICFNVPQVTIDGNVLRVYTRFYEDKRNVDEVKTKKAIRADLMTIIPQKSGDFNQGLMEIGETLCLPKGTPRCQLCPLQKDCQSYLHQTYDQIPIKKMKAPKLEEHYTILIFIYNSQVAIEKRQDPGLLQHLWQFPNLKGELSLEDVSQHLKDYQISYKTIQSDIHYQHTFTHKKWLLSSFEIELLKQPNFPSYQWININSLNDTYAIPSAFRPIKEYLIKRSDK